MPMKREDDKQYLRRLLEEIRSICRRSLAIMEVCGTHTVAIAKSGIRQLLPPEIKLISGPGCPVCVTDASDLDAMLYLAGQPGVITATFGDMIRVPGSQTSLQEARGRGADVRVVYSPLDAVSLARENPTRPVVFLAVGFETTAPTVAVAVETAWREGIENFSIYCAHKLVPPAMRALLDDPANQVDGFLNPGHVCTILGTRPFEFVAQEYHRPCVVTGFEPADILEAILMILRQHQSGDWQVAIQYQRAVKPEGNPVALAYLDKYFAPNDADWRGLGTIPASGLGLREEYQHLDARRRFAIPQEPSRPIPGCACGEILKGRLSPLECPLFGKACTPARPVGPCMVSTEGSCAAYYRYIPAEGGSR